MKITDTTDAMSPQNIKMTKKRPRNCHYFLLFKVNDNLTIQNIIRNHNVDNIDKDTFKDFYVECTQQPMNFMMLDLKTDLWTTTLENRSYQ